MGEIVNSVFQEYRRDVGKSDNHSTKELLAKVTSWVNVGFTKGISTDLKDLKTRRATPIGRAWAILFCLRFF